MDYKHVSIELIIEKLKELKEKNQDWKLPQLHVDLDICLEDLTLKPSSSKSEPNKRVIIIDI